MLNSFSLGSICLTLSLGACSAQAVTLQPAAGAPYSREATKSGELLYAASTASDNVLVFSYPQGTLVQTLTGFKDPPSFICSDQSGNVFVPTINVSGPPTNIYEFAHGGTQPIETLIDPGPGVGQSCSVDRTTGNLAVANYGNVAIYQRAQGTPTIYEASDVAALDCVYDASGNLFIDGNSSQNKIAELPAGAHSFSDISLSQPLLTGPLQWSNKRLLIEEPSITTKGPYEIFPVRVSGSEGAVGTPVVLRGKNKHRGNQFEEFVISGNTMVMPGGPGDASKNFWHYPKGGKPYKIINLKPHDQHFSGMTISR